MEKRKEKRERGKGKWMGKGEKRKGRRKGREFFLCLGRHGPGFSKNLGYNTLEDKVIK